MLQMLIKPSSQKCNIDCLYCFYKDMSTKFGGDRGYMKNETMDIIIKKAASEDDIVHFIFQGGEPLIMGTDFYQNVIDQMNKYPNVKFIVSIQTNGTLIDEEWIKIFQKLPELVVGISIDGAQKTHDSNRMDYDKVGTFNRIMKSIRLLKKNNINFSILSVATSEFIKNIDENLESLSSNFNSIQILWPIPSVEGKQYITNDEFFTLHEKLWLFFKNKIKGIKDSKKMIYISNIDFLFKKLITGKSAPFFDGNEINELVIEANGEVFPGDFFTYPEYSMGTIMDKSFKELMINEQEKKLKYRANSEVGTKTKNSKYFEIIGPGNLRFRNSESNEFIYLKGYERFLDKYLDDIKSLLNK